MTRTTTQTFDPRSADGDDQASGLREMFANRPTQVLAFAAGGSQCGRTTLVVEAAGALARLGNRVIVVDENEDQANAINTLGATGSGDLLDALIIRTPLNQLVRQVAPNLWAAPAVKAAAMLRFDSPKALEIAATLMTPMEAVANYVLIDSRVLEGGHLSLLSAQAHHMVVVVSAKADAITQAYAVIKRMAGERGRDGFHLAVTRARSDKEAETIYGNVMKTAERHLNVRVEFFGNLSYPLPHNLGQTLLARLPMANAGPAQRYRN